MTDNFESFLSMPWWFTIPLVICYFTLLVYVLYLMWKLRQGQQTQYE
jgi:hypothetical protein